MGVQIPSWSQALGIPIGPLAGPNVREYIKCHERRESGVEK